MKTLKIGIASYDRMKQRTMAIARGEHKPAQGRADGLVHLHRELCEGALGA